MPRFARALSVLLLLAVAAFAALPAATAWAAPEALTEAEAVAVLQGYRVVYGDQNGDLQLNSPLTRAQAAAIFVRAMGAAQLTSNVAGPVPFSDIEGHWAQREITLAARLALLRGDDTGRFRPDDLLTGAELLTVLLRMLEREPVVPWTPEAVYQQAAQVGIAPAGMIPTAPVLRRQAFWALATALTSVPVGSDPNLAARYLDSLPPQLQLDPVATSVATSSVRVSGTAQGAVRVLVAGQEAEFDISTRRFSHSVELEVGLNQIAVEAIDAAGNRTSQTLTVARQGEISRITIDGPKTLATNTAAALTVKATDRSGNPVPLYEAEATVTGVDATFEPSTATLSIGAETGKGTLTLNAGSARATFSFTVVTPSAKGRALAIDAVNKSQPLAVDQAYTVTVRVVDENGKTVTDDYGRAISLVSAGTAGITLTPDKPVTEKGIATFTVVGTSIGYATLTATTAGLEAGTLDVDVLTGTRVILLPSVKSLSPDGTSTVLIKAQLQDGSGRRMVNNTTSDIRVRLTAGGTDATLSNTLLVIPRGKSDTGSSGATLTAGIIPGTVTITGEFESDHDYAVQALRFPVTSPLAGSRFRLTASPATQSPGQAVTINLEVVDGNGRLVKDGAYAFRLKVTSSNNEALYRGLPQGVSLTFANSPYYPVDDGVADGHPDKDPYSVIGRTHEGKATFTLRYFRSGVITVEVLPLAATEEAYNPVGGPGAAADSTFLWGEPLAVTFRGSADRIVLSVDSELGEDQVAGALGGAGTMKLTARVVDADGTPVPGYNELVTLKRATGGDGVTSVLGLFERKAENGEVTFTIAAQDKAGVDRYYVEARGLGTSEPVVVAVRKHKAETPVVVAIRGVSDSDPAATPGYVGPEADYMEVQLARVGTDDAPPYWVLAEVYRSGRSTPLYTQVINLNQEIPVIRVPRENLTPGTATYHVAIDNGYSKSAKSTTLDSIAQVLVADKNSRYALRSASFDAATGRLILSTTGLSSQGTFDPARLTLVLGARRLPLDEAEVVSVGSTRVILDLGDLAAELDPAEWYGQVQLTAESRWYVDKSGSGVAGAVDGVSVTPMATLFSAQLDPVGKRLYLSGAGLTQGSISWNLVKLNGGGASVALRPQYDKVTVLTDTEAIITLSAATLKSMLELAGPEVYLTAEQGWIRTGSGTALARGAALTGPDRPVTLRILATAAVYNPATDELTLKGSGFKGMTLNPALLRFQTGPGAQAPDITATAPTTATEDGSIVIQLAPVEAERLEYYTGNNVYINTAEGWLTDPAGWPAAPLPAWSLMVYVPAP